MPQDVMDAVQLRQRIETALWTVIPNRLVGVALNTERELLRMFPESGFWSQVFLRRTDLEGLAFNEEGLTVDESGVVVSRKGFDRYAQLSRFGMIRDVGYHCLGCDGYVLGGPRLSVVDDFEADKTFRWTRRLDYGCTSCDTNMLSFSEGDSSEVLAQRPPAESSVFVSYPLAG